MESYQSMGVGGVYELNLYYEGSEERLRAALVALWKHPALEGCYLKIDVPFAEQARIRPEELPPTDNRVYGVCTLPPDGQRVPCATVVHSDLYEVYGRKYREVALYMRESELGITPEKDDLWWTVYVNKWLAGIAREIFAQVPFAIGRIGPEGLPSRVEIDFSAEDAPERGAYSYLQPVPGGLEWYPATYSYMDI